MAAKYLVVLGAEEAASSIGALHVPLDSVVLLEAAKERNKGGLGVEAPFGKWTAIRDYSAYLAYQESIRKSLGKGVPSSSGSSMRGTRPARAAAERLA